MFGVGPNGGGGNPFTDYLLGLVAADNPSVVANAASSVGIPPPSPNPGSVGFGNLFNPLPQGGTDFPEGVFTGMGGAPGIGGGANPAAGGGINPLAAKALGSMAGVKAPPGVAAPIFNAGVSGAQKAPEVAASGAGGTQMLQLLKLLQASGGPAATPAKPLGSYF